MAVVADAANVSGEGKLNILGIFEDLYAPTLPAVHPIMVLAVSMRAEMQEQGMKHMLEVKLIDADGHTVNYVGPLPFEAVIPPSARAINIPMIIHLTNLKFEKFGNYRFDLYLNGDLLKEVPLTLSQTRTS
ncbi:hypothetical protein CCAX7_18870 [Capsulimonas corticalis]|uniref:Uncharacterized protein n=1 Tax=Capsulimonas corticalis TaxID=2219043 RepID=A0A9N7L1Q8_9BACT|nr:hypothetical protein CCAX7_18870 [Capsulimonas corticalis]